MHNFKNSKGKKGFITWKIDLSKAYDRLNWNFIKHVLVELRLPVDLVRLIKSCVTIVRYQLCVNGELTTPFVHLNGIRQVVNFEKSAIYCSPNTCKELAKEISYICGSPLTNNLGKYLGMLLLHSRVTKATYESLVDKVKHRLASWKGKFLSLAGRATFIQAVTASIPIYAMQTTKLPATVCDDLDKLNRNFFWGGGEKKQKIHLCQ
ncbi:unnamed protein product [Prunus armeniaca]